VSISLVRACVETPYPPLQGHNPDLVIFDDAGGIELERIELNALTTDEIHALVLSKGFKEIPVEDRKPPEMGHTPMSGADKMPTQAHAERRASMEKTAAAAKEAGENRKAAEVLAAAAKLHAKEAAFAEAAAKLEL
jgi:hypothetical protein